MSEIIISLRDVCLTYKVRRSGFRSIKVPALRGVSFDVYRGETLGIIGRNGSGKSTLLRVLAGIFKPEQGAVLSKTRSIALMTLHLGIDPLLSGRDNAIFGGMLLGFDRKEVEDRVDEIGVFSGLGVKFDQPMKSYSTGMAARLKFSIAINLAPDVMLLDEALAVGDRAFRARAYAAMKSKIDSDQTAILVSHSENEIAKLCDRVVLLEQGEVVAQGDTAELLERYTGLLGGEPS